MGVLHMACAYSEGVAAAIEERWAGYPYDRDDVVEMVARISRPSSRKVTDPVNSEERALAEILLAACD